MCMESQVYTLEKVKPSSSRMSHLDAKAESCIRRHQVKEFINAGSKPSAMNFLENDENSQLASHLLQLKTSCSGVKAEIKHRQFQQYRHQDETVLISEKVRLIQTERNKLDGQITKLKSLVEDVRSKEVNAVLSFKSYQHILDRMKKDQIRNQIKRNQLGKELKNLQKNYNNLKNKNYDLKEYGYLSSIGLKEAQSQVKELKNFRTSTMTNMSRVVDEKEVLQKKKQDRKDKSDMIKQMAAGDLQDADMIRLKRFSTVQMFLKALLKGKIQKLKDFYEPYELAFLKIKGNTNVKDSSSLKSEYRNFETSYNEKAAWVNHLEEEIAKNQITRKSLKKELSGLKLQEMQILEKLEEEEGHTEASVDKELQQKAKNCQIMMMEVKQWLKEQQRKMGLDSANKSEEEMLTEICENLKKSKEKIKSEVEKVIQHPQQAELI